MPLIDRTGEGRTDPDAGHTHSVLVVVETPQRLAEQLAGPVVAVGASRVCGPDAVVDGVIASSVIGRGEDNSPATLQAGRLDHRPGAPDVRLEDLFEGRFDRNRG